MKLAREAREISGRDVYIAGSIGPIGDVGDREDDRAALFAEQAALLEGRGVDLIVLETFYDLDELVTAVEAVRSAVSRPIVALMSFDSDGETLGGVHAADAAERVRGLGLAAFGANHGAGLRAALRALESMSGAGIAARRAAERRARLDRRPAASSTRTRRPSTSPTSPRTPSGSARGLIGGCCGTTPAEIGAIRAAVDQHHEPSTAIAPRPRERARRVRAGGVRDEAAADAPRRASSSSRSSSTRRAAATPRRCSPSRASSPRRVPCDVVDVNDNPMARARMNALLASIAIERESGLETIPHVTPRDTSVMGLQSILLGAHADGIRNILAVTGDPPEVGDYAGARGVYEVDSIGLTQILGRLNDGTDFNGREIDAPTSFFPGVAVNPTADDLDAELERFARKIEAGAKFAMTQALFDLGFLERMLERLGRPQPDPAARRRLLRAQPPAGAAAAQRGARASSCPRPSRPRCETPARAPPPWAWRWRASSSRAPATWPPACT